MVSQQCRATNHKQCPLQIYSEGPDGPRIEPCACYCHAQDPARRRREPVVAGQRTTLRGAIGRSVHMPAIEAADYAEHRN